MKKKLNYSPSPAKRSSKQIHENTHWSFQRSFAFDSPSKQYGNKNPTQLQSVMELSENFKKKILMNVQLLDSIQQRSMPQRCQLHNNIFSLYCQTQRKPLCASCVYQNDSHRKHNVIPVNQSAHLLKDDVNRSREKLDKFISQLSKTIKERQKIIEQIQQQYPHYIVKLQKYYTNLHEILVRKEKEQINQIRYFKDKVRYQNAAIATQLNQIACFLIQKLQRSGKVTDENALSQYRILSCLNSAQGFLKKSMEPITLGQGVVNSKVFTAAAQYLSRTLLLSFPQQVSHDQYLKQTYNSNQKQTQNNERKNQKYLKSQSSLFKQSNPQSSNQKLMHTNLSSQKLKTAKEIPIVPMTPSPINISKNTANKTQIQKSKKPSPIKNSNNKTEDPYHMTFSPNKNNSFSQMKNNKSSKNIKIEDKTPPKQKNQSKKLSQNKKSPNTKSPDRSKSKTPEIGAKRLKTNNSMQNKKKSPSRTQAENVRHERSKVPCIYHATKKDKSPTPNKRKPQ